MKQTQWVIGLCVAAVMVFGIAFAVNWLPARTRSRPPKPDAPEARLTFADAVTNFPTSGPPAACEVGHAQSHDFWFKNENAQDVPVGVFSKSCQCTSVQLAIAPKDWKDVPAPDEREKVLKQLEATPTELKNNEAAVSVPAGAVGLVRLGWTSDREGSKDLSADLWMGEKGAGPNQHFAIYAQFVGPVMAPPEIDAGEILLERLPQTVTIRCGSLTRSDFPLDARLLHSRLKEGSNPFEVGKPVKMTAEETAELRKDSRYGPVLAGYKTPITLARVSADGTTPFDLGPFRQRVELKTEGAEPMAVVVTGKIRGDLAPANTATVPVMFEPFERTQAVDRPILLESGADVTSLELDRGTADRPRTPDFLDVEFPETPEVSGDRKLWSVRVKWVPSSQASGVFPRDEDGYRDSAVYVRPVYAKKDGPAPPCLRIPVRGTADTRQ